MFPFKSLIMNNMKYFSFLFLLAFLSCHSNRLSVSEKRLINSGHSDSAMQVLSVFNFNDSVVLRQTALRISKPSNKNVQLLAQRMLSTVQHPDSRGVGIAAPQVGISRRFILVQRFDKENRPFEKYFNPEIIARSGDTVLRDEGCLSIPGFRGPVERPNSIQIQYTNDEGEVITESVEGFTARIFQHEIDHLNGKLYIDLLAADSLLRAEE